MSVRIALPYPSADSEYNARSFQPYVDAVLDAGAEALPISLDVPVAVMRESLACAHGVLLPGSKFDVDPARYGEQRQAKCGDSDELRAKVDTLLLDDAFRSLKPVLAICHGAQSLCAWAGGKLIQDLKTEVVHRAGHATEDAHAAMLLPGSRLAAIAAPYGGLLQRVNSTHHQAVRIPGARMRAVALSPQDSVIEAIELVSDPHFVLAIQWHPERLTVKSAFARAIFRTFVEAASSWSEAEVHNV